MSSGARKLLDDAYALDDADRAIVSAELSDEGVEDPEQVRKAWVKVALERLERLERGEAGALRDSIKDR